MLQVIPPLAVKSSKPSCHACGLASPSSPILCGTVIVGASSGASWDRRGTSCLVFTLAEQVLGLAEIVVDVVTVVAALEYDRGEPLPGHV
jgi:hypothetical protein